MAGKKNSVEDILRERLTAEQYQVTQEKGTEHPFTGKYNDCKTPGMYACICCGAELFDSTTKFDSGSGWPSFFASVDPARIRVERDTSGGTIRDEILCADCGAHLGHVFADGPQPTGQRYCVNSASLELEEKDQESAE